MITLVLGGNRSGKSEVAEHLASESNAPPITFVATADARGDRDFAARIAAHRVRRPPDWDTIECGPGPALVRLLRDREGTVLVDSLGTWLAGHHDFVVDTSALLTALADRRDPAVLVSDEVGWGVHPPTESGRRFRDALGELNHQIADAADEVVLVIAGRVLPLHRPDGS